MSSPLNVDRFVTLYRAAKASRRIFVIDPYQAFVLHLIARQVRIPLPSERSRLRVFVPPRYRAGAGRKLAHTAWAKRLPEAAITLEEVKADAAKDVMLFRESMLPWLYPTGLPAAATCLFPTGRFPPRAAASSLAGAGPRPRRALPSAACQWSRASR